MPFLNNEQQEPSYKSYPLISHSIALTLSEIFLTTKLYQYDITKNICWLYQPTYFCFYHHKKIKDHWFDIKLFSSHHYPSRESCVNDCVHLEQCKRFLTFLNLYPTDPNSPSKILKYFLKVFDEKLFTPIPLRWK